MTIDDKIAIIPIVSTIDDMMNSETKNRKYLERAECNIGDEVILMGYYTNSQSFEQCFNNRSTEFLRQELESETNNCFGQHAENTLTGVKSKIISINCSEENEYEMQVEVNKMNYFYSKGGPILLASNASKYCGVNVGVQRNVHSLNDDEIRFKDINVRWDQHVLGVCSNHPLLL